MNKKDLISFLLSVDADRVRIEQESAQTITASFVMSRGDFEGLVQPHLDNPESTTIKGELRGIERADDNRPGEGITYRYTVLFFKF